MKKEFAALVLIMLLCLTACSQNRASNLSDESVSAPESIETPTSSTVEDVAENTGNSSEEPKLKDRLPEGWRTYEFRGLAYDLPGNWSETRDDTIVTYTSEDGPGMSLSALPKAEFEAIGQGTLEQQRDVLLQNDNLLDGDSVAIRIGDYEAMRIDIVDRTNYIPNEDGKLLPEQVAEGEGRVMHIVIVDMGNEVLTCFGIYAETWGEVYGPVMKQVVGSLRKA